MLKPLWSFVPPTEMQVRDFLRTQVDQTFSYRPIGATQGHPPRGFVYDDNHMQLGDGAEIFRRACEALAAWKMFPMSWTRITPAETGEIKVGLTVAMQAHALGLWWLNACRIVYLVDEQAPVRRWGFAYGTLPAHLEQGEELFTIEQWADGTVWYRVQAFSRPHYWPVKMAAPVARMLQRKFVRDSQAAMLQSVQTPE
jgi:uncharacterized protein (UPF0548 family)